MALKIFISSVFHEMINERLGLEEQIRKLQELFVGMEYFGSDPASPAEYCINRVQDSDIYVAMIGASYGSIDNIRDKSFTEIEYDAATDPKYNIPCLIYFKETETVPEEDNKLIEFKRKLGVRHIVHKFKNLEELKNQFLIDFIKLLRGPLFYKVYPNPAIQIPAETLRVFCQGFLNERIKAVAQDKYIPEIYIERHAEKNILEFINFEEHFRTKISIIFNDLITIHRSYRLERISEEKMINIQKGLEYLKDSYTGLDILQELKYGFYFQEVDELIKLIESIRLIKDISRFSERLIPVMSRFRSLSFISPDDLADVPNTLLELYRRMIISKKNSESLWKDLLRLFPSSSDSQESLKLANDLLREIHQLIELHGKRCLAIVDRAGRGKTNVICHQAQLIAEKYPVILLSGQMEISDAYGLEQQVQRQLELEFHGIFIDWMNRLSLDHSNTGKWMFIIIDGINENSNLSLLTRLLSQFLAKLERRRIKLIVTCRDIFWEIFEHHLQSYLFGSKPIILDDFTEDEWKSAITLYFERYRIQAELSEMDRSELRNPLLLRFFCESNQDSELGIVSSLRLVSVFDHYLHRVSRNIADRIGLLRRDTVIDFLLQVGTLMWRMHTTDVPLAELGLNLEQLSQVDSIYNLIRSENIILEESTGQYSKQRYIRFIYDTFAEYVVACAWREQIDREYTEYALIEEAATSITAFPVAFGAILFLDNILNKEGRLVNFAIAQIGAFQEDFLATRQYTMLQAFENISIATIDDILLDVLDQFEQIAREDIKQKLAPIILNIQMHYPNHPRVREIIGRVLEVDTDSATPVDENSEKISIVTMLGEKIQIVEEVTKHSPLPPAGEGSERLLDKLNRGLLTVGLSTDNTVSLPHLPPGRFHYTDETKLNAIALLIASEGEKAYTLAGTAIERLGRLDLHSALSALKALDMASDEALFSMLPRYLREKDGNPEYRIYCAWLMRSRYGAGPAEYLIQLLLDNNSRVHEFTMSLFDERRIEKNLLEDILRLLKKSSELETWHLINLVRLLGKRSQFSQPGLIQNYGSDVANALISLCTIPWQAVRLEAYRSLMSWSEFFDSGQVIELLNAEKDPCLKRLISKFKI